MKRGDLSNTATAPVHATLNVALGERRCSVITKTKPNKKIIFAVTSTVRTVAFFWVCVCSIDPSVSRAGSSRPPPRRRPPVVDKHPFAAPSRQMGEGIQFASIPSKLFCPALSLTSAIKENQCGGTHRWGCRADSEPPLPPLLEQINPRREGRQLTINMYVFFLFFGGNHTA